jgi:hypothetical protein
MRFWKDRLAASSDRKGSGSRILRHGIGFLAVFLGLMFGALSLFVVPAPDANTAVEVSGTLVSLSPPHPEYGDFGIVLDRGRSYYVNRADQVEYFAWEQMLSDVHVGDTVYLTVVTPLITRLMGDRDRQHLPVAGIRTASEVYMDPAISADIWTARSTFQSVASLSLFLLVTCLLPELIELFKHHPPTNAAGV